MTRFIETAFVFLFNTILMSSLGLCGYWLFIDTDPPAKHTFVSATHKDGSIVKTAKPGDEILITRDSCVTDEGMAFYNRTLVRSIVNRALVNSELGLFYFVSSGEVLLIKGCRRSFNTVLIPPYAVPGHYSYVVTVNFQNNPLYSSKYVLPVPEFDVIN